ncbi:MAG: hypothetical protein AB8G18_05085 [Gammaproteobacteria bacterium]
MRAVNTCPGENKVPTTWNFELRAFIRSVRDLLPVTHRLHKGIDKEFREHRIEIAFPQQDLHFDDKPISIQLVEGKLSTE